jgi:hypothetical protein
MITVHHIYPLSQISFPYTMPFGLVSMLWVETQSVFLTLWEINKTLEKTLVTTWFGN